MGATLLRLLFPLLLLLLLLLLRLLQLSQFSHSSLPIGAHPLHEKFYESTLIKCKDGSKSFTRDRINDNFCDCPDGSDEPGTSACPSGKFYCMNVGSTPKFLYSSRVNDHICDCCDGSDEYDGTIYCPNTCITGGNIAYRSISYDPKVRLKNSFHKGRYKLGLSAKESIEKLKGLKVVLILQVVFVILIMAYWAHRRHCISRRRHSL